MQKIKIFILKMPSAFFMILIASSALFKNLPVTIETVKLFIKQFATMAAERGLGEISFPSALYYIMYGIISLGFFEIVAHVIGMIGRQFALFKVEVGQFKQYLRVGYIIGNLVIGAFSMLYFAVPALVDFTYGNVDYLVFTVIYLSGYLLLCKDLIFPDRYLFAFKQIFKIYFLFYGIMAVVNMISSFAPPFSATFAISNGINLTLIGVSIYLSFTVIQKKLIKFENDYVKPPEEKRFVFKKFDI